MKKILCLDGGGMRGYIPCKALADFEQLTGKSCHEHFDLIAGTSIGGILALLLALGIPASEALKFFTEDGPNIFKRTPWRFFRLIYSSMYSASTIEERLWVKMSKNGESLHLSDLKTKVLIPSLDIKSKSPLFFQNFIEGGINWPLWKIARATSAAEIYFPAYEMDAKKILIDGGNVANNPSACAMANGWKLFGDDFKIVSLGCGGEPEKFDAIKVGRGGAWRWLPFLIGMLFDSGAEDANYQCEAALDKKFLRLYPHTNQDLPLDGATPKHLKNLNENAERFSKWAAPRMADFVSQ